MDSSQYDGGSSRRYGGFSVVVLAHVILAYALVTTLAHTMKSIVNQEVPVKILDEKVPPPLPPPELSLPPPPNLVTPPPPFIPPPEVPVQQPLVNPIAVTTAITPPAQPFAKTLATQPLAAPPAISHFPPVPAFADLNACKPVYPRASLLAEEVGTVRVEFVIGADGQLVSNKIVKSSGHANLDKAAVNGLSHCKFKPAYLEGKPVQSSFLSDYVWRLDE